MEQSEVTQYLEEQAYETFRYYFNKASSEQFEWHDSRRF